MAKLDPQIVALTSVDGRIQIEFLWQHDRFAHRILLDQVELARSVEGDASESWPPSPPLQQLSLEEIKGTDMILGVGSAGRTHWSLSVEIETQDHDATTLRFELASRCREPDGGVRSTYTAADSIRFEPMVGTRIDDQGTAASAGRRICIRPSHGDHSHGDHSHGDHSHGDHRHGDHRHGDQNAATEPQLPATLCWTYRVVVPR